MLRAFPIASRARYSDAAESITVQGVGVQAEMATFIGRRRLEHDEVSLPLCRRLAALLDRDPESVRAGQELPLGWACILFADVAPHSALGADGHPTRGEFLPAVALQNRRFAGRSVRIHRPLFIGQAVERCSTIASIEHKQGRSGEMIFVTLIHEVADHAGPVYSERQTVVYLHAAHATETPAPAELPLASWEESFVPDAVSLFRYSAVTFNGHRIHYDMDYAMTVEGYPGLVMNGGLTTLRLLESARLRLTQPVLEYRVRAIRPLFAGRKVVMRGTMTTGGAQLWAVDDQDRAAMNIDLTFDRGLDAASHNTHSI